MSKNDLLTLGRRVRIVYRDGAGEITERTIDIERIYTSGTGAAVVIAFCHRRGATRTFSVASILAAMPDTNTEIETFASDRPPGIQTPPRNISALLPTILPYGGSTDSAARLSGWN